MKENLFQYSYNENKRPHFILNNLNEDGLKQQDFREFVKYLSGLPAKISEEEQEDLKKLINLYIKDNPDENYQYLPAYGSMSFLGFCMVFTPLNKDNLDNIFYNHSIQLNLKNEERLYLMTYLTGNDNRKNNFSHDPKRISYNQKINALININYLEEYKFKPIVGKNQHKGHLYEFFIKENLNNDFAKTYRKLINIDFKKDPDYSCYQFLTQTNELTLLNKYEQVKTDIIDIFEHNKNSSFMFRAYDELIIKNQILFSDIPSLYPESSLSDLEKIKDHLESRIFNYILEHHSGYTEEDNINLVFNLIERLQTLPYQTNLDLGEYFSQFFEGHMDRLYDQISSSGFGGNKETLENSFNHLTEPLYVYFNTFVEKRDLLKNINEQTSEKTNIQKRRI